MASSKETYCLCGQPYNIGQFMIECDCCREWFHGSCVDVKIYQSDDIDKYHCPKCVPTYGPSVFKIPTNSHRADRYELGAENRPSQCGTPVWVRSLSETPLRPSAAALQRMRPHQFTEDFVRDNGFTRPVIFHTTDGLDMKIPNPATFTVRSVLRYCGAQHEVEVIDVRKQSTLRMPLGEFVDYFETPPEHRSDKVLNVLSLEFSDTKLAPLVEPPHVLGSLDWSVRAWPAAEARPPRPAVQKYCLVSAAGSYTDFHVDFGGTTVWYHVLHGRKIFYLIPPTSTNLALYQQWNASPTQSEQFFGDMVEWYGTAELNAGQTLFIPSGWIHAVLTPRDSLVFGGNLLHSYAVEMQLQIYEIERRVDTPLMFRYPLFEAMNWYAGAHLLTMLRRHNEEIQDEEFTLGEVATSATPAALPALLLRGIKILANALKEWHALKATDPVKRDNVPKCLNSGQLVRELCKELRTLEKRSASIANKDKDFKPKSQSPTKQVKKQSTPAKKSLKLTLPKPIMHMAHNGEYPDEKIYADKFFIDDKEVFPEKFIQDVKYTEEKYVVDDKYVADGKYVVDINGKYLVDANGKFLEDNSGKFVVNNTKYVVNDGKFVEERDVKDYVYQTYEEISYQQPYVERDKKATVLKIKLNNSPSSSREEPPPPPYPVEHSILKSHLVRARPPAQQWTISKKEGEYQQVLYTNEHLQSVRNDDQAYGPGMYSTEDIQQDYQYSETAKPGSYHPEYYSPDAAFSYARYEDSPPVVHQGASYTNQPIVQEPVNGYNQLPSYDAAIAQQYTAVNGDNTGYVIEEQKPVPSAPSPSCPAPAPSLAPSSLPSPSPCPAPPVRRSERPVRRRVSNTYDYEDSDLYIDDTPAPRRRKPNKHKHTYRHAVPVASSSSNPAPYRQPAVGAAPTNGIESLIQASVLADEHPVNDTEDAAVAGMLSIGEQRYTPRFGLAAVAAAVTDDDTPAPDSSITSPPSAGRRPRKPTLSVTLRDEYDDEEDVIKEVHRDEEYVYPSLEMSSDEDEEWTTTRRRRNSRNRTDKTKADKDESWSPRARLGRLTPRVRGPRRAGVRRECVRAALHAAAAAALHAPAPHAPAPAPHHHTQNAKRAVLATKSKRPPPPVHNTPKNQNIRLKKGMKTAKQRLGKILKIHKMIY